MPFGAANAWLCIWPRIQKWPAGRTLMLPIRAGLTLTRVKRRWRRGNAWWLSRAEIEFGCLAFAGSQRLQPVQAVATASQRQEAVVEDGEARAVTDGHDGRVWQPC